MKVKDDYNWEQYTQSHYEKELNGNYRNQNIAMIVSDFNIVKNELVMNDNLHPNWKQLYHLIYKLGVKSVYECGCGCAHHLINAKIVNPNLQVNGCDYSQSQIDLGYKYFNLQKYDFAKNLKVLDFVNVKDVESLGKHEFVYTQAVTMHLSFENAKKFMENMKKISSKYVFLVENINLHDYNKLVGEVFSDWEKIIDNKYINYGILLKRK